MLLELQVVEFAQLSCVGCLVVGHDQCGGTKRSDFQEYLSQSPPDCILVNMAMSSLFMCNVQVLASSKAIEIASNVNVAQGGSMRLKSAKVLILIIKQEIGVDRLAHLDQEA